MESAEHPVVIVGAGPVGLTAALALARHGVPVRIIDQSDGPSIHSKALVIWRRTLQVLDPLIPCERFEARHHRVSGVRFLEGEKTLAELGFDDAGRAIPAGLFVPQDHTEEILIEQMSARNIVVERGTELRALRADDTGVEIDVEGPEGREVIRTPWLIGCDGAHSAVRHNLGVDFPGETRARRFVLADLSVEEEVDPGVMQMNMGSQGFVALFPIESNRWRVIADEGVVDSEGSPEEVTLEAVLAILHARTPLRPTVTDVHWLADFRVNERQIDSYTHGRVVLVGDAAHVHSPAGGQGMNTGIQDAMNLAWKIGLVQSGGAPMDLVETYQSERHRIGAEVLRNSRRILQTATLTDGFLQRLRGVALPLMTHLPPVRRRLTNMLTEDAITYRDGPLAGIRRESVAAGPGDACPDLWLMIGGSAVSATNLLRDAQATLLVFAPAHPPESLTFGIGGGGFPVTIQILDADRMGESHLASLARALGLGDEGGYVLIRPDSIIAAVEQDLADIHRWMEQRLTGRGR